MLKLNKLKIIKLLNSICFKHFVMNKQLLNINKHKYSMIVY